MMFKKLSKYKNLFLEQDSMELYSLVNGEMQPISNEAVIQLQSSVNEEYKRVTLEAMDMEDRLAAMDAKVASGEISCNLDNPEDCENCGS